MNKSIFEKLKIEATTLGAFSDEAHGTFAYPRFSGKLGPEMYYNDQEIINWSLNNYLGFADEDEIKRIESEFVRKYGLTYPMGSRVMSGNTQEHEIFEKELAQFTGFESAFLQNLGYQGVMSTIETLVNHRDAIVYDSECHACLIDGVRLHKAKGGIHFRYLHNNMESLEKNLNRASKYVHTTGGGVLLITEGVFGMTGKVAKLDHIIQLKEKYNFQILLDDAHGFGAIGLNGKGTHEHFGLTDEIDVYFSTFTKSLASMGGFVASSTDVVRYLKYNSRSQIFSRTLPLGFVKSARYKLSLLQEEPERRERLWYIARKLQKGLSQAGFDINATETYITPVIFRQEYKSHEVANLLHDMRLNMGLYCSGVVYPVVPKGIILLRLTPTPVHTEEHVKYTIECFKEAREKLNRGHYDDPELFKKELELTKLL